MIEVFRSEASSTERLERIRGFLDLAFDGRLSDDDWLHALGGWHVTATVGGELVAHGAVVERALEVGGRTFRAGYIEAVATHPDHRHGGHGTEVMGALGKILRERFELGALSTGAHAFYERLGWERWQGPSFVRDGTRTLRSSDEDAGILVLRFGPSAGLDLTSPITCASRSGDDW